MCGIAGVVRADPEAPVSTGSLRRMARALQHRGPDGYGLAHGRGVGLVSTRLAVMDVEHAWQPMQTEPGGSVIVYNGEVYNAPELRRGLAAEGARFRTTGDTEVVLQSLERHGLAALQDLNGQFALAWWQPQLRRLTLVRDRFGVRPLHWTTTPGGDLLFGSEAAALFATGEVQAAPDLLGLDDVFTLWGTRAPRSAFAGVRRLDAGSYLVWEDGRVVEEATWWVPDVAPQGGAAGDLLDLLGDSVRLRLRADIPVGTYLSGGLDSSLITAMATEVNDHDLRTFSVAFEDPVYDESAQQLEVARALGTQHHVVRVSGAAIAAAFRDTVRHVESPLVRTAPVPMGLLAQETRAQGITVVATGEGADELFWGYDLYKEVVARRAGSADALDALYPHLGAQARGDAWRRAFLDAGPADDPLFSHQVRLNATGAVRALYGEQLRTAVQACPSADRLRAELPVAFDGWDPLQRATWLELRTLLEPYLLAAQGDRVAMAHGVEGRYPFLDHRVFEHAMRLAPSRKLDGDHDKVALRELAARVLPPSIAGRRKQPYRAPEVAPFFGPGAPAWVDEALSPAALRTVGLFDEARTAVLLRRCREGRAQGPREAMALTAVLSTQVWHEQFCGADRRVLLDAPQEPRVQLDIEHGRERQPA